MTRTAIRVGTRGSALALWQAKWVSERLNAQGHKTELVEIRTTGDVVKDVPLSQIGSRALFTRQIDDAMLAGRIDLAVHSLKDLPTVLPQGIQIAAVAEREDPRDALVGKGMIEWDTLPDHAIVGTSSLRRRAQLLHARPDLKVMDLRGNVDTRLAKLHAHRTWSAIVLACAGLVRLGLANRIGERLPVEVMLPAPGQGALAVTAPGEKSVAAEAARGAVHHPATELAVSAERAFLRALEGGCQVPVAALATITRGVLRLQGRVVALGGERSAEGIEAGSAGNVKDAESIGAALASRLLGEGAQEILAAVRASQPVPVSEP